MFPIGRFAFDNSYAKLQGPFFARVRPTPVRSPKILRLNHGLARGLGLDADALDSPEGAAIFAGNEVPEGAEPIALAYAGHQFGHFVPQLGDGRAILLGELIGTDGARRDVQLKGSGRTPFSRGGDGRAALGPVLREYLLGEAMFALGVPTTRALAAVATGEIVMREEPLPGAVLTRVASSHLRVGTFEFFATRDREALRVLTDYALQRHYPESKDGGALALLERVIEAQARLVARWLGIGFVHGVMNTDNTSISGETIDYGPCAFLDEYDPSKVFSSIDRHGRYAYANQPRIAQWNLARLAEALLPLIADDEQEAIRVAMERLERFPALHQAAYAEVMRKKLGLSRNEPEDLALAQRLLALMAESAVDYTIFFRALCASAADAAADPQLALLVPSPALTSWLESWRRRLALDGRSPNEVATSMRAANPAFIPRNHRVEQLIEAAIHQQDLTPFERLLHVLERPYEDQPEHADLATPPLPHERVEATFCGT